MCPLFKIGNRKDPSNYLPVSLTESVVRLWNIVNSNVMLHMESNQICNLDFENVVLLSYSYYKQFMISLAIKMQSQMDLIFAAKA